MEVFSQYDMIIVQRKGREHWNVALSLLFRLTFMMVVFLLVVPVYIRSQYDTIVMANSSGPRDLQTS